MILTFDKFSKYEIPQLTLCNPHSRVTITDGQVQLSNSVGTISNPDDLQLDLNFNAPHELTFDYILQKSTDQTKQSFYSEIYDGLEVGRFVFIDTVGYFKIIKVVDNDENKTNRKNITAESCEVELNKCECPEIEEGTYTLTNNEHTGLLDTLFPVLGWTIKYIDSDIRQNIYFEKTEVGNVYDFLYTTVQDAAECIIEPNIITREISIYAQINYTKTHLTDIHIAKHNLLKHRNIEQGEDDLFTAINVQGKSEDLDIRSVNPTGKNTLYNFEQKYKYMSDSLKSALDKWEGKIASCEEEYFNLQQSYNSERTTLLNLQADIDVLNTRIKVLNQTRDTIIADSEQLTTYVTSYSEKTIIESCNELLKYVANTAVKKQIQDIPRKIEGKQNALDIVNALLEITQMQKDLKSDSYSLYKEQVETKYTSRISNINTECALDITAKDIHGNSIFTADLINELSGYIETADYSDEYMLVNDKMTYTEKLEQSKELMRRAKIQLIKISSGKKSYSLNTESFLFNEKFKRFSEQLVTGAIVYVEIYDDVIEQLHLTKISINFKDKSTNFTLGNKYDKNDDKSVYEDVLGKYSKTASQIKYALDLVNNNIKEMNRIYNWVDQLQTLTLDNVLNSKDQSIVIDDRGYLGRKRQKADDDTDKEDSHGNPLFDEEQLKIINNGLYITKDNWKHLATAIGKIATGYNSDGTTHYEYGIIGDVIIGKLLLGEQLGLYGGTKNGGVYSITLDNKGLIITNDGTSAGLVIKKADGTKQFYADESGNLHLSGVIDWDLTNLPSDMVTTGDFEELQGKTDKSIKTVDVEFYLSESPTQLINGSWQTTAPEWVNGKYMWSRTKTVLQDGAISYKPSESGTCIAGAQGVNGQSVVSIAEEYYLSTSKVIEKDGEWTSVCPNWEKGKYLWTRIKIVYCNPDSVDYTSPICDSVWDVVNDLQNQADVSVKAVDIEFYLSESPTQLINGSWQTTAPEWVNGKYMWSRTKVTQRNDTVYYRPSNNGTCIAGATGVSGRSVLSVSEEYYLSTSKEQPENNQWESTCPLWEYGKYIWTRLKIVYLNPSGTEYTEPLCDSIWEVSNEVISVSQSAKTLANLIKDGIGFKTEISGQYVISPVIAGGSLLIGDKNGTHAEITTDGKLIANGAYITGKVEANEGTIGGWEIKSWCIRKEIKDKFEVLIRAPEELGGAGSEGKHDVIKVANLAEGTIPFLLTSDGAIKAEKGTIGGWGIDSWHMYKKTNDFEVFLRAPTSASESGGEGDVLIVHDLKKSTYPFILKSSGTLVATKADITGKITATSGSFTGSVTATSGNFSRDITIAGRSISQWMDSSGQIININANSGTLGKWVINGNSLYMENKTLQRSVYLDPSELAVSEGKGGGSVRWYCVYGAGKIYENEHSDERVKNSIECYDDRYEMLFDELIPRKYKYNYGTSGRFHTGFVAQEVVKAIEKSGLTTNDFAAVMLECPNSQYESWYLRRDEFVSLNTWQIQKAKKRIKTLEEEVEILKTQVKQLTAG